MAWLDPKEPGTKPISSDTPDHLSRTCKGDGRELVLRHQRADVAESSHKGKVPGAGGWLSGRVPA
jgi:hypothetical protein